MNNFLTAYMVILRGILALIKENCIGWVLLYLKSFFRVFPLKHSKGVNCRILNDPENGYLGSEVGIDETTSVGLLTLV